MESYFKAVDDRNNSINEALSSAEKAKSEMEQLSADNKKILNEGFNRKRCNHKGSKRHKD